MVGRICCSKVWWGSSWQEGGCCFENHGFVSGVVGGLHGAWLTMCISSPIPFAGDAVLRCALCC